MSFSASDSCIYSMNSALLIQGKKKFWTSKHYLSKKKKKKSYLKFFYVCKESCILYETLFMQTKNWESLWESKCPEEPSLLRCSVTWITVQEKKHKVKGHHRKYSLFLKNFITVYCFLLLCTNTKLYPYPVSDCHKV